MRTACIRKLFGLSSQRIQLAERVFDNVSKLPAVAAVAMFLVALNSDTLAGGADCKIELYDPISGDEIESNRLFHGSIDPPQSDAFMLTRDREENHWRVERSIFIDPQTRGFAASGNLRPGRSYEIVFVGNPYDGLVPGGVKPRPPDAECQTQPIYMSIKNSE